MWRGIRDILKSLENTKWNENPGYSNIWIHMGHWTHGAKHPSQIIVIPKYLNLWDLEPGHRWSLDSLLMNPQAKIENPLALVMSLSALKTSKVTCWRPQMWCQTSPDWVIWVAFLSTWLVSGRQPVSLRVTAVPPEWSGNMAKRWSKREWIRWRNAGPTPVQIRSLFHFQFSMIQWQNKNPTDVPTTF